MDYVIAVPATILCTPLLVGIAVWIKLDSPGPVFFKQKRVGLHKEYFEILKFRTMRADTQKDVPTHLLQNPEQYITKAGKILRATSLDELPQLINILKGEMSLVGPRPALWNQYDLIEERDRYGANDVLPGLTGWAQIHGRDTVSIPEKAKLDGYYVEHQSVWMDIKCLFLTVVAVLRKDGVQEGAVTGERKENDQEEKRSEQEIGQEIEQEIGQEITQLTHKAHEQETERIDKEGTDKAEADKEKIDKVETDKAETEEPLVSVVVATYHREKELAVALESLARQSWKNLEILLVDDNAEEQWNQKVEKIVHKFQEKHTTRFVYLKNEKNLGSAASRNRGIAQAKGRYVTFLDDDDKYRKDKIRYQTEHMLKVGSQVSIADLALYREDGNLEEVRRRWYLEAEQIQRKEHLLAKHFLYHMTGTDTLMFEREFLQSIGGFSAIDLGDEFYLMEKAIRAKGAISYLARCDVKALVHRTSEGMSSGERKIEGENALFSHKKKYWASMSGKEKRQICMRHHMVLGYVYLRKGQYEKFFIEGIQAFLYAPLACISMVMKK